MSSLGIVFDVTTRQIGCSAGSSATHESVAGTVLANLRMKDDGRRLAASLAPTNQCSAGGGGRSIRSLLSDKFRSLAASAFLRGFRDATLRRWLVLVSACSASRKDCPRRWQVVQRFSGGIDRCLPCCILSFCCFGLLGGSSSTTIIARERFALLKSASLACCTGQLHGACTSGTT